MKSTYKERTNEKLREGALELLDQLPEQGLPRDNHQLLGFAIDMHFWHYFAGPYILPLIMKTYLLFETKNAVMFISVKKLNNYKFRYKKHFFVNKNSASTKLSNGFLNNTLTVRTQDGKKYVLRFSKTIEWNQPAIIQRLLDKPSDKS